MVRWLVVLWSSSALAVEIETVQLSQSIGAGDWTYWVILSLVLVCTMAAITWLIWSRMQLNRHHKRLRAIWENIPDIITEVDNHGVIVAVNKPFSEDVDVNSLIGSSSFAYLDDQGKALFEQCLEQALITGRSSEYELQVKADGHLRHTHNRIIPINPEHSEDGHALVITTDVTRYKEAEQILQKDKQYSEHLLNSKAQFLMNVNHEMRGPLSALKDSLTALRDDDQLKQNRNIENIKANVDQLTQVVNDLSVLTEGKAKPQSLEVISTSLWHLLDDLEALYVPQAQQKKIAFQVKHQALPHYIQTDSFKLRQILYNLLMCHLSICDQSNLGLEIEKTKLINEPVLKFTFTNTLKADEAQLWEGFFNQTIEDSLMGSMDANSVACVKVSHHLSQQLEGSIGAKLHESGVLQQWFILSLPWVQQSDPLLLFQTQSVYLAIKDTEVNHWFSVFFQSLHIPVVQYQGGKKLPQDLILLVSDYIKESQARWFWWLGEDEIATQQHAVSLTKPFVRENLYYRLKDYQNSRSSVSKIKESGRILLVEDNLNNQFVIQRLLEKMGFEVVVANDGKEGVEAFKNEPVICIIMDVLMPVMDGIEATKVIRALDVPQVPIIALTANSQREIEDACYEAGMDSFLTKPISRNALEATINQYIGLDERLEQPHQVKE